MAVHRRNYAVRICKVCFGIRGMYPYAVPLAFLDARLYTSFLLCSVAQLYHNHYIPYVLLLFSLGCAKDLQGPYSFLRLRRL